MAKNLADEIKQTRPFRSLRQETYLALQRTADELQARVAAVLKPFGISTTQYNVLRILRGAEPTGHRCSEIGNRMITREPDITRLLDRLTKAGWISRQRDSVDRRVVMARITSQGLKLLKEIDKPIGDLDKTVFAGMNDKDLKALLELLNRAREE